jgi:hypothetical protein
VPVILAVGRLQSKTLSQKKQQKSLYEYKYNRPLISMGIVAPRRLLLRKN